MLRNDANRNISYNGANWAFQVKSLLDSLGLSYLWLEQTELDMPYVLIKQRILDLYYQSWYANINNSNRLVSYARYKHNFDREDYLNTISEPKYRVALCRFRLSSHDLAIERGRYAGIPANERICKCCNMKVVENEYHFILVCPGYKDIRKKVSLTVLLPLAKFE